MAEDHKPSLPDPAHRYSLRDVIVILTVTVAAVSAFWRLEGTVRTESAAWRERATSLAQRLDAVTTRLDTMAARLDLLTGQVDSNAKGLREGTE